VRARAEPADTVRRAHAQTTEMAEVGIVSCLLPIISVAVAERMRQKLETT
jgi:hypothetical protein